MNNITLFVILFFIISLLCWNCWNYWYYPPVTNYQQSFTETTTQLPQKECVCAFDIDHTISCGNPKPFVDLCIANGCRLAINTARPVKYIKDVDLTSINFTEPYFDDSDFYYNQYSYSQSPRQVAEVKSGFLELLQNKYSIKDKSCVILLDDNQTNVDVANENEFSTIKAIHSNDTTCGLNNLDLYSLGDILNGCSELS